MKRSNVVKIIEKIFNLKMFAIFVIIAFLGAGYIYSFKIRGTTYEAKTTLLVSEITEPENSNTRNFDEIISTYVEMTKSNSVINEAIQRLQIENFNEENIKIERKNSSDFIEILVIDNDSELAKKLSKEISNVILERNLLQLNLANLEIIDSAENNCKVIYTNHASDITAFVVMGCFVSLVSCQLIKTFDNKLKSKKDIESLDVKELIELPKIDKKIENTIIKLENKSMFAEAFKIMRTNIQFINFKSKQKIIMVTEASTKKDLKSFIISNLAVGYANTGKKVMLIDSDIRNGNISKVFNIVSDFGLANYLSSVDLDGLEINENNIGKYIKNSNIKNLDIITTGYLAPNPSELITSKKFKETLNVLEKVYDIVLVNVATEDLWGISEFIKSCIVVTEYNRMNKSLMTKIRNQFELKEGKVIGVVLAKVPMYKLKYFNRYSIYLKSDEEDLKSKKNIKLIEAKEEKEEKRKQKAEEKSFKNEVKRIEKEKAKEVKLRKKEEKALNKKEYNENTFIFKINNIKNNIVEFIENVLKKVKTRNKRLTDKIHEPAGIISESVNKEEERFKDDKKALESVINSNIQKDAIIQNLEKEILSKNEEILDDEYIDEISKEYNEISEQYQKEIKENLKKEEVEEEVAEEKVKDNVLKINKIKNIFKGIKDKEIDEENITQIADEIIEENDKKQKIKDTIEKVKNRIISATQRKEEPDVLLEVVEEQNKEEIKIENAEKENETVEEKKDLTYEEKYMNNYNELYNSEYSYSSTTSFADFERGNNSKIDKSEKALLDQNEKLDLDNIFSKKENVNNSVKIEEDNLDFEAIMKKQAEEEEQLIKNEKEDFENFKKELKAKKKAEKLEKKRLKKLEKESKMKINDLSVLDKKQEIDQEEEYLMENLYPKFK